jgi:hypothetical protein
MVFWYAGFIQRYKKRGNVCVEDFSHYFSMILLITIQTSLLHPTAENNCLAVCVLEDK